MFDNIIGNLKVKNLLTQSICTNNVLHSYMFVGPNGVGKCLFAKDFAKMILCNSDVVTDKSCNACKSCIEFDSNNHPDFMVVNSDDGKSIKIEQVRFLQEKIAEKPVSSNKKVYIINDADLMTNEAQNCLLKTLEEPPEYATIILVLSNEYKLLPTIKSRCTKIAFSKLSNDEICNYFSLMNYDFSFSDNMLKVCDGSISRALKLNDEKEDYSEIDVIINNLSRSDIVDIWNNSEVLYKAKDNIYDLLDYINIVCMNNLISNNDLRFANCVKIVENTKNRLNANANYEMCIDNLLLAMWEEFNEKHSRS